MYETFYKYIKALPNGRYRIEKNGEYFGVYPDLPTALFERDRLKAVDWDWEEYVHLPEQYNNYRHIDLPPFKNEPSYISHEKECWVVRDKRTQKYRGRYMSFEEAKKVALIYDANISHKNGGYRIRRSVNGKNYYYGSFQNREEAEKRVEELKKNNWRK